MVMLHIKLKVIYVRQHTSKHFAHTRTPTPEWVKRLKQFFSENGHINYQIKGNDTYNIMQAIRLSLNAPSTPGVGSKQSFFLKVVMLHIKLEGMKRTIACKQIFYPYTNPRLKVKTCFLLKVVMLHIKLTGRLVLHIPRSSISWVGWGSW